MEKTLELLKNYASTTENVFLLRKIELLELEIGLEITRAKLSVVNELEEKI